MANTTGNDRLQITPWTQDINLKAPFAIPAAQTTFYSSQLIGRDVNGNLVQADDTAAFEFVGVLQEFIRVTVDTTDVVQTNGILGDKMALVDMPFAFIALIAAAAAGDEGKKCYIKYNNEVSYSTGTFGNFAGTVLRVIDSTHVLVRTPWTHSTTQGGMRGVVALTDAAHTLTKFDVNKSFQVPVSTARTITLPAVALTSPGDRITVTNTGGSFVITLKGNGSENINGANTLAQTGAIYATSTVESDGTQWIKV